MTSQQFLIYDFETRSKCDLRKAGAFEYAMDPSTDILCVAWRLGTRENLLTQPISVWSPMPRTPVNPIEELQDILNNPEVKLVCHNAFFENVITRYVLSRYVKLNPIPVSRYICTAAQAAALALPRSLEGACLALGTAMQKDMIGRRLMLKYCKPRKVTKTNSDTWHKDPAELEKIMLYCMKDVAAQTDVFMRTPLLPPTERKVWELDQKINLNGFAVDRALVSAILKMIEIETISANQRTADTTGGILATANQRSGVLAFLKSHGVFLPDLTKKTVDDAIESGLIPEGPAREILDCRQIISKTSTAKYKAFELRSRHDGRVRDILRYHAATTGRWGGSGVQPQNLKRSSIKNTNQAAEIAATGDLEMLRLIYGSPMSTFSDLLRSVIVPSKGKVFDVADYAAIEARVLFWVAKHEAGLQAFREGRDLYIEQAAKVFNKPAASIAKDSLERFIGKGLILGCGFQLGHVRFAETCRAQGNPISEDLAKAAVASYREMHYPVVVLWSNFQKAAEAAITYPGKRISVNYTTWYTKNGFLFCELPSGRRLAYPRPSIKWGYRFAGNTEKSPILYHWTTDFKGAWAEAKTYGGRLTENVVQAIARDLMAEAMLRIDAAGWDIVLTVHDEIVAERDINSNNTNKDFCRLMAKVPDWAKGCPVTAEGWSGERYRK